MIVLTYQIVPVSERFCIILFYIIFFVMVYLIAKFYILAVGPAFPSDQGRTKQ
jgi:hypothetical protein